MQGLNLPTSNLIFSNGEDWRFQRRKVAPAFSQKHVDLMIPNLLRVADLVVQRLHCCGNQRSVEFRTIVDNATKMVMLENALDTKLDLVNSEEDQRDLLTVRAADFVDKTNMLLQSPWQLQLSWLLPYSLGRFLLRPTFRNFIRSYERLEGSCAKVCVCVCACILLCRRVASVSESASSCISAHAPSTRALIRGDASVQVAAARKQLLASGVPLAPHQQSDLLSFLLELQDDAQIASNISAFYIAGRRLPPRNARPDSRHSRSRRSLRLP